MELCLRSARAIETSCLWPCEKLAPPADTGMSRVIITWESFSAAVSEPKLDDPIVSSLSTPRIEGDREAAREDLADMYAVSVTIWTR